MAFYPSADDGRLQRDEPAAQLSLLASAIAGRTVAVAICDDERCWSDGHRILLSTSLDEAGIRDALIVQAILIAAGSLDPRVVARLAGRRRPRLRYLTLEVQRAISELGTLLPARVVAAVADVYDGPVSRSAAESLRRAISGAESLPEAPQWFGTIRPAKALLASSLFGGGALTEDDKRGDFQDAGFPEMDDEEESEESRVMKLLSAPVMQSAMMRYLQKMMGMGRSPEPGSGEGGADMPVGSHRAGPVGKNAQRAEDSTAHLAAVADFASPSAHVYPEWNCDTGRYRAHWTSVAEYDPAPEPIDFSESAVRHTDRSLLAAVARLGLRPERHRRQDDGDVLDFTALLEHVATRRGGRGTPSGGVYEARRVTGRDLGVLVLLDTTGSTAESDEVSSVFDEQRDLAHSLTAAFSDVGDRIATYGFQSWGRRNVQFLRIKGFDDRYDAAVQRRLRGLEPGGFTRMGAVIRHGTRMLVQHSGATNNLLLVIGDAFPYDDGYEHAYAEGDCHRALLEAVEAGVGCVGPSVRTSTDAAMLERVWGDVAHDVIHDPRSLPAKLPSLMRRALAEAAASRRRAG
ncbi:von Willebrand factor type A [Mycolicibacterium rhodesiae JS60]|nr:von Willebrand factor type A [Mycolicibacterium rhodesiae JS60]